MGERKPTSNWQVHMSTFCLCGAILWKSGFPLMKNPGCFGDPALLPISRSVLPPGENFKIMTWSETHVEPETRVDCFILFRYQCSFYTWMGLSKNGVPCSIHLLISIFPIKGTMCWVPDFQTPKSMYGWLYIHDSMYIPIIYPFNSMNFASGHLLGGLWKNISVRQLGWWNSQYMESHNPVMFQSPPSSNK